jgi:hypothetical protein
MPGKAAGVGAAPRSPQKRFPAGFVGLDGLHERIVVAGRRIVSVRLRLPGWPSRCPKGLQWRAPDRCWTRDYPLGD